MGLMEGIVTGIRMLGLLAARAPINGYVAMDMPNSAAGTSG